MFEWIPFYPAGGHLDYIQYFYFMTCLTFVTISIVFYIFYELFICIFKINKKERYQYSIFNQKIEFLKSLGYEVKSYKDIDNRLREVYRDIKKKKLESAFQFDVESAMDESSGRTNEFNFEDMSFLDSVIERQKKQDGGLDETQKLVQDESGDFDEFVNNPEPTDEEKQNLQDFKARVRFKSEDIGREQNSTLSMVKKDSANVEDADKEENFESQKIITELGGNDPIDPQLEKTTSNMISTPTIEITVTDDTPYTEEQAGEEEKDVTPRSRGATKDSFGKMSYIPKNEKQNDNLSVRGSEYGSFLNPAPKRSKFQNYRNNDNQNSNMQNSIAGSKLSYNHGGSFVQRLTKHMRKMSFASSRMSVSKDALNLVREVKKHETNKDVRKFLPMFRLNKRKPPKNFKFKQYISRIFIFISVLCFLMIFNLGSGFKIIPYSITIAINYLVFVTAIIKHITNANRSKNRTNGLFHVARQ